MKNYVKLNYNYNILPNEEKKERNTSEKNNYFYSSVQLNDFINDLSKKKYTNIKNRENIINNSMHKKINVNLNRYDDEKSEIEDGKNNNTINLEKSYKFPKIQNIFKSQESLFQDNADKKFTSLISVKPQIKEQLKTKNRCMVGKREFLIFKNSKKIDAYNPFYESIKIKEEMKNILK